MQRPRPVPAHETSDPKGSCWDMPIVTTGCPLESWFQRARSSAAQYLSFGYATNRTAEQPSRLFDPHDLDPAVRRSLGGKPGKWFVIAMTHRVEAPTVGSLAGEIIDHRLGAAA